MHLDKLDNLVLAATYRLMRLLSPPVAASGRPLGPRTRDGAVAEGDGRWGPAGKGIETPTQLSRLLSSLRRVVEAVVTYEGPEAPDEAELRKMVTEGLAGCLEPFTDLSDPEQTRLVEKMLGELFDLSLLAKLLAHPPVPRSATNEITVEEHGLVYGGDDGFASLIDKLPLIADNPYPVHIRGETGTGKELIANMIHRLSRLKDGPMVTVNCAELAEGVLESELFGHVRGAFTGAVRDRRGKLELASGGTLFLDEVGEASPGLQVKLLRVIEQGQVIPVGGTTPRIVDFRLVTATNRNLREQVDRGRFRADLYHRLVVLPLTLPPLRERPADIPLLLDFYLTEVCVEVKKPRRLDPELIRVFSEYQWPGNVRELINILRRLVVMSSGPTIRPTDMPPDMAGGAPAGADHTQEELHQTLSDLEGLGEASRRPLARYLAQNRGKTLSNKDIRDLLGCSDSTAKNYLNTLSRAGIVRRIGERGGRRYKVK